MAIRNLKGKGSDQYFKEVEDKLIEETNYTLELKQSQVVAACRKIDNLLLPEYYPEYSSEKIITGLDGRSSSFSV
jgi:predicted unusual protein kinase regulating ubiquinone biosynthesis (AarF/ABC1/UbiB family)